MGMALLVGGHLGLVKAEESSIMTGATVTSALDHWFKSGDVIINGSYKSFIKTASSSNPVNVEIALLYPQTLQTVVLVAPSRDVWHANKIGSSVIVLKNGLTEVVGKSGIYDTGIYTLDTPAEATSIIIRRVSGSYNLVLAHVRAY